MAGIAVAVIVSLSLAAAALRVGPRLGFVDRPEDGSLKAHTRPAVPLGGISVFLGVHTGMTIEGIYDPGLSTATGGLLVLGLLDDRFQLAPSVRLVAEVMLAVVMVGFADGGWSAQPLALVVGIVLVVGAINAVNLFDGMDGLAGTSAAVAAVGIAALAEARGLNGIFGFILAGAVIGFLALNWHPAKLFLGDNGSYVLGAFLAYGIMRVSPEPIDSRLVVAAVLLGVFALDLATTIIRRRLAGRPLFIGDRGHLYDQLLDRGWTIPRTVAAMGALQIAYVGISTAIEQVRSGPGRLGLVAAVAIASLLFVRAGGFLRLQPD